MSSSQEVVQEMEAKQSVCLPVSEGAAIPLANQRGLAARAKLGLKQGLRLRLGHALPPPLELDAAYEGSDHDHQP